MKKVWSKLNMLLRVCTAVVDRMLHYTACFSMLPVSGLLQYSLLPVSGLQQYTVTTRHRLVASDMLCDFLRVLPQGRGEDILIEAGP